jgi:hypothetical protein
MESLFKKKRTTKKTHFAFQYLGIFNGVGTIKKVDSLQFIWYKVQSVLKEYFKYQQITRKIKQYQIYYRFNVTINSQKVCMLEIIDTKENISFIFSINKEKHLNIFKTKYPYNMTSMFTSNMYVEWSDKEAKIKEIKHSKATPCSMVSQDIRRIEHKDDVKRIFNFIQTLEAFNLKPH